MLTFEWTDAYLATPTENLNKSQLDDALRKFRRGIREVMGREHDWGPGTGNTGKHKAGAVELVQFGSISARDAISNPVPGLCFIVQDAGISELWVYMDDAWHKVGTNDHAALANLTQDAHPRYYKNANETIEGEIAAAGHDIQFEGTPSEIETGLVTSAHLLHPHSRIGSLDALSLSPQSVTKLSKELLDFSIELTIAITSYDIDISDGGRPCSVPNIQVDCPGLPTQSPATLAIWLLPNDVVGSLPQGLHLYRLLDSGGAPYNTSWHIKAVRFNSW